MSRAQAICGRSPAIYTLFLGVFVAVRIFMRFLVRVAVSFAVSGRVCFGLVTGAFVMLGMFRHIGQSQTEADNCGEQGA
jgi:hypothetical protein